MESRCSSSRRHRSTGPGRREKSSMSLASISIKRPVFAWMLMIALIVFGGIAFTRLGVSQFPDIDLPIVSIQLSLPGAAPEVMESDVVDTAESAAIQGE